MAGKQDPFGRRPKRKTGRAAPVRSDRAASDRASDATKALKTVWIDHEPQTAIIAQLRKFRNDTVGMRGVPLTGRRLGQASQAGKSATMERLKKVLAEERAAAGLPPNPYQVVIVECDIRMTLKGFYQEVLQKLGDQFWDQTASAKVLEARIREWSLRLEVELIIADEVQHLDRRGSEASEVTERFKVFLDRGVVPLVLVGDEKAEAFFRKNPKLSARLGTPLRLEPLDPDASDADLKLFARFCDALDRALVECGATSTPSSFRDDNTLDALLAVSGGHVGRVARLIEEALPEAVWRGAASVEPYDLSNATRTYAVENGWIGYDPFSIPYARRSCGK